VYKIICKICGYPKSKHIKVLIREKGLGSKVVSTKLKCPKRIAYFKAKEK